MTDQLDLFAKVHESKDQPADMIPFPCSRRVGRARRAAEVIARKPTDKARQAYWRDTTSKLAAQMSRVGIEDHLIEREITSFHTLVQRLLDSQTMGSAQK